MEKNMKKNTHTYKCIHRCLYIHIYIKLNHLAVQLKLTQHCKSTTLQKGYKVNFGGVIIHSTVILSLALSLYSF